METVATASEAYGIDVSPTYIYYADFNKGLYKITKANSTTTALLYKSRVSAVKIFKSEGIVFSASNWYFIYRLYVVVKV